MATPSTDASTAPSPSASVSHNDNIQSVPTIETATHSVSSDEEITAAKDPMKGKRSKVWQDFEVKILGDGTSKAYCKHCKKNFDPSSKLGTTHLRNHLKVCKIKKHSTSGQKLLCNSFSSNLPPKLANWKYDSRNSRLDFARMVAKHDYPFLMAEHDYFRVFINGICPMYKWVSRTTVRQDVMQLYNESKTEFQDFFDKLSSKVSFTTDMWTPDYQNLGYCCVTCHYIDNEWVLHKKIIAYLTVPTPHTGIVLSEVIKSTAMAWNLDRKLFAITVDNASNNNSMVVDLKDWLKRKGVLCLDGSLFHIRCSAHILNLIVQYGLDVIAPFIAKIRESAKYGKNSQSRYEKFLNALSQTRLTGKGVSMDVPTRWNSTYDMLCSAIQVRRAFERLADLAPDYKHLPSCEEWEMGINICECLKVFNDATLHFSGVQYPTANLHFKTVCDIHHHILLWLDSDFHYIRDMAKAMKVKFDKYWSESSLLMSFGVVLDPCYKMQFIEYAFTMLYGKDSKQEDDVKTSLNELYTLYALPNSVVDIVSSPSRLNLSSGGDQVSSKMDEGFLSFMKQRSDSSRVPKTELEKYLEEDLFPFDSNGKGCDILVWWKNNGPKFPILARMARDILAVPVSSVASESAFSSGGRIITDSRSSLGVDSVEALVCLKDWLPKLNVPIAADLDT